MSPQNLADALPKILTSLQNHISSSLTLISRQGLCTEVVSYDSCQVHWKPWFTWYGLAWSLWSKLSADFLDLADSIFFGLYRGVCHILLSAQPSRMSLRMPALSPRVVLAMRLGSGSVGRDNRVKGRMYSEHIVDKELVHAMQSFETLV